MQIKVETAAIQRALDIVSKTAPPIEGEVTFRGKAGKVTLMSIADLSRCTVVVPCDLEGEGDFAILIQSLRDASKGHKELNLSYTEGTLTVKSGSYKAQLATMDVIEPDELTAEETKDWKISGEVGAWLKQAVKEVGLKPTSILSSWMPIGIKVSDNGAFVACYDEQHMSWVRNAELKGNFECLLPIDTIRAVLDVFSESNFMIQQSRSAIRVRNKLADVVLSVPSTEDIRTVSEVRSKIKEAMVMSATSFVLEPKQVQTFMENARSVIGKERAEIQFTCGAGKSGDSIELLVKTGQGTVKRLVKGQTKAKAGSSFRVDMEYVQEQLAKAGDKLKLNVVSDSFLSMRLATGASAIVGLNQ